jgi:hypothetical protein
LRLVFIKIFTGGIRLDADHTPIINHLNGELLKYAFVIALGAFASAWRIINILNKKQDRAEFNKYVENHSLEHKDFNDRLIGIYQSISKIEVTQNQLVDQGKNMAEKIDNMPEKIVKLLLPKDN